MTPEQIRERVLFRDGQVLILDKPAGLAVHAGSNGGESLRDYRADLRFGIAPLPEPAHRLDRDTSGCLVLGRVPKAITRLGRLFSSGQVRKTYWAVVVGAPPDASGTIDYPLAKKNRRAGWRMEVDAKGQPSVTGYRVIGSGDGLAWLALEPKTGRTHQLRVHLAALGCPILGDPVYGADASRPADFPLHLHAREIRIPYYPRRELLKAVAEVPDHMKDRMRVCGWKDGPRTSVESAA
jgi:RluA family pseudouridine synthase